MTSLQNLFVAKLPRNLTDSDLEQIFSSFEPESAKIMLDATTGKSKGFGFVLFDSVEKGEKAYKSLNKTHVTLHGHSFNLAIFPSKHDGKVANETSQCLYIRNLPKELSQTGVENFLRTFGNLTYCAMREDHYGSPVWVVYAEYENVEEAKNALTKLHGSRNYFENSPVAILAKYADSEEAKKERRRRRESQQQQQHQQQQQQHSGASGRGGPYGEVDHSGGQPSSRNRDSATPHHPQPSHQGGSKGYNNHFYKGGGVARHNGGIGSAEDLYMPLPNDAGSDRGSNPYASDDVASNATPCPQQQQQHHQQQQQPPATTGTSFGAFNTRSASSGFASVPMQRFAPPSRGTPAKSTVSPLGRTGSMDSTTVGAFGTPADATTVLPARQQQHQPTVADAPMSLRRFDSGNNNNNQNSAIAAPLTGSANNPTPLSQSFLGVTFPTGNAHFEQSSTERTTPPTPLTFNFDPESEGQQMGGGLGGAAGGGASPSSGVAPGPNGMYPERSPVRGTSALSGRSIGNAASSGTRYRHNPYAPVTPINSAPSSAGPSTPRVAAVSPHSACGFNGGGPANMAHQQPDTSSPHQAVNVTMHFGHSHTNSNGGPIAGTHFASAGINNTYLAVPDPRGQQQQP